jgi:hypothetical protein
MSAIQSTTSTRSQSLPPEYYQDDQRRLMSEVDYERKWTDAIDRLLVLLSVPADWDGEGAVAPSKEIIKSAIDLFKSERFRGNVVGPPDRISPMHDGRIVLEWNVQGFYANVRVDGIGKAQSLVVKPDKTTVISVWEWSCIQP